MLFVGTGRTFPFARGLKQPIDLAVVEVGTGGRFDATNLLEPLVDVQLLDVTAVETTGEFRYRYQGMVRLFAAEQLAAQGDPAGRDAAQRRMLGG